MEFGSDLIFERWIIERYECLKGVENDLLSQVTDVYIIS